MPERLKNLYSIFRKSFFYWFISNANIVQKIEIPTDTDSTAVFFSSIAAIYAAWLYKVLAGCIFLIKARGAPFLPMCLECSAFSLSLFLSLYIHSTHWPCVYTYVCIHIIIFSLNNEHWNNLNPFHPTWPFLAPKLITRCKFFRAIMLRP